MIFVEKIHISDLERAGDGRGVQSLEGVRQAPRNGDPTLEMFVSFLVFVFVDFENQHLKVLNMLFKFVSKYKYFVQITGES